MSKALLIAEKKSLMDLIKDVYLNNRSKIPFDMDFTFQAGHIVGLKLPHELDAKQKTWCWENLPFFPEQYGGWQYKVIPGKEKMYKDIYAKIHSHSYDFIIHAGDPDQEGQLLCNLLLSEMKNTLPVKRFWTNDLTDSKILNALLNLQDNDKDTFLINLGKAGLARQHSDYKIGMNISEATSLKLNDRCAIGRVKTPILKIIVDRELAIKNFKPETTYELQSKYKEKFDGILYSIVEKNITNTKFKTKEDCINFTKKLSNKAKVITVNKNKETTTAPPLFKLSALQTEANKIGYEASQTLGLAQSLYEKKFLSYPRTSCEFLSSGLDFKKLLQSVSVFDEFKPFVNKITTKDIENIKKNTKYINDAKLKEAGHYALSPTETKPNLSILTEDEKVILKLIFRQFLAIFLPPLIQDKTVIVTENNKYTFRTTGKILVSKGFSELFNTSFTDVELPDLKNGDIVNVDKFEILERTTTCPARFNDGTLIDLMESPLKYLEDQNLKNTMKKCKGIGTDATRNSIIDQLCEKDNYIEKKKGKGKSFLIFATQKGINLIENLGDRDICKVDLTAQWEDDLNDIRLGTKKFDSFEKEMDAYVIKLIDEIKNSDMISNPYAKFETIGKCPFCSKNIYDTNKYFLCEGYKKDCNFIVSKVTSGKKITSKDILNLTNKKPTKAMEFIGKSGKKFIASLDLDYESKQVKFNFNNDETVIDKCPDCGGSVIDKNTYCKCNKCNFSISYKIKGTSLTKTDIKKILKGKETDPKKMGNGTVKISYDPKTKKLIFNNK